MSLQFDTTKPDRVEASLEGRVTVAEVAELRRRLTEGSEPDVVHMENLAVLPSSFEIAISSFNKAPFPKKPVAFVCSTGLEFGFARMVATYYDLDRFQICSSLEEALRWISTQ